MLKYHELIGFMPPKLAEEILNFAFTDEKALYRTLMAAVADARKLRPAFFEKKPRVERHKEMLDFLSRPRQEGAAADMVRTWLIKKQTPMLVDFLDALGIPHQDGIAQDFPKEIPDDRMTAGVELLLSKYPHETVAIYLNAFHAMNDASFPRLGAFLQDDPRLQLA